LAWERTTISTEVVPGQKEATGVFKFTNGGAVPVRINDVHANCGCTAAKPAKVVFAPGESGELPTTMTLSGTSRSVSVQVKTDEPTKSNYTLTFQVTLAEAVQMTPRLLFWKMNEPPVAKRMTLKLRPGVSIVRAVVLGGAFTANLEPAENGEAVVWVTPGETGMKSQATLKLSGQQGDRPVELEGFLRVL